MSIERKVEILKELRKRERYNKIDYYDPYPYQVRFHKTGKNCNQRLLMAANRIGKSYCGSSELAFHLTGIYPEWWEDEENLMRLHPSYPQRKALIRRKYEQKKQQKKSK